MTYTYQLGGPSPFPIIKDFRTDPRTAWGGTMPKAHKLMKYGSEPECPRCGFRGYDDWWHVLSERKGLQPGGRLRCGSCEKAFFIEGTPGNLFSSAFGLDETDRLLRAVGL